MTTPLTSLQSSGNLDKMRKMAVIYNDCSGAKQLEVDSTDWTQQFVDESRLACNFRDEMVIFLLVYKNRKEIIMES
jgi:hypothetical protein